CRPVAFDPIAGGLQCREWVENGNVDLCRRYVAGDPEDRKAATARVVRDDGGVAARVLRRLEADPFPADGVVEVRYAAGAAGMGRDGAACCQRATRGDAAIAGIRWHIDET